MYQQQIPIPANTIVRKQSPRNQTIALSTKERLRYRKQLKTINRAVSIKEILDTTINQNMLEAIPRLPPKQVDFLFLDPPYNLTKTFNGNKFTQMKTEEYTKWLESWFVQLLPLLKATASIYICGDWRSSSSIFTVASKYLVVRNRITWERERGRGVKTNRENVSEDIWLCTASEDYTFNVNKVKLKRKVLAPYKHTKGRHSIRPLFGFSHYPCSGKKTSAPLYRYRERRAVLLFSEKTTGPSRVGLNYPRLWSGCVLGAQCAY